VWPSAQRVQLLLQSPLSQSQSLARAQWLQDRQAELLDTQYFHVVFTVPEQIATIAYQNKRELYGILFRATAQTLLTIGADPKHLGAKIGFFAVLHTWGSNLLHHPHLHCVVPGGGLAADGSQWTCCREGFFLSVRVLSRLFRRLFLEYLVNAFNAGKLESQQKTMTLQAEEFIRRFLLHVLPEGFQRIRYYGFLANRYREQKLAHCRELLGMPAAEPATSKASNDYRDRNEELTGSSLWKCPACHQGRMLTIEILPQSPHQYLTPIKDTS
jgi:hypothetical protein